MVHCNSSSQGLIKRLLERISKHIQFHTVGHES
jgi:hypothetical protein